jgi:phage baseplate assembly protein W
MRKGFSLPFRFDSSGRLARAQGRTKDAQDIASLVLTRRGERVFRPNLGVRQDILFRDATTLAPLLAADVRRVVDEFDPSLEIVRVLADAIDSEVRILLIVRDAQGEYELELTA